MSEVICPKCGGGEIRTEYCTGAYSAGLGRILGWGFDPRNCFTKGEHLHRACENCGYNWLDQTLDQRQLESGVDGERGG